MKWVLGHYEMCRTLRCEYHCRYGQIAKLSKGSSEMADKSFDAKRLSKLLAAPEVPDIFKFATLSRS